MLSNTQVLGFPEVEGLLRSAAWRLHVAKIASCTVQIHASAERIPVQLAQAKTVSLPSGSNDAATSTSSTKLLAWNKNLELNLDPTILQYPSPARNLPRTTLCKPALMAKFFACKRISYHTIGTLWTTCPGFFSFTTLAASLFAHGTSEDHPNTDAAWEFSCKSPTP